MKKIIMALTAAILIGLSGYASQAVEASVQEVREIEVSIPSIGAGRAVNIGSLEPGYSYTIEINLRAGAGSGSLFFALSTNGESTSYNANDGSWDNHFGSANNRITNNRWTGSVTDERYIFVGNHGRGILSNISGVIRITRIGTNPQVAETANNENVLEIEVSIPLIEANSAVNLGRFYFDPELRYSIEYDVRAQNGHGLFVGLSADGSNTLGHNGRLWHAFSLGGNHVKTSLVFPHVVHTPNLNIEIPPVMIEGEHYVLVGNASNVVLNDVTGTIRIAQID